MIVISSVYVYFKTSIEKWNLYNGMTFSKSEGTDFTLYQIIHEILHVVKMIVSSNKDFTKDF